MMKKFNLILAVILCSAVSLFSQTGLTMPAPRVLNEAVMNGETTVFPVGQYSFTGWESTNASGTYPANMLFYTLFTSDPDITSELTTVYSDVYNSTSSGKINGRGANGISMGNSGSTKLGAAVLSLNTTGRSNINVAWSASTVTPASGYGSNTPKTMSYALQYRMSETSTWTTVANNTYNSSLTANVVENFTGVLPAECDNQPLVQVRWIYYWSNRTATTTGSTRARIGLDDISITSSPADLSAIGVPSPVYPGDVAAGVELNPTLTWNAAANATSYKIQVSLENTFTTNLVDEVLTTTSKALTALPNFTQYFWRVQAINATTTSAWSTTRSFTTIAVPPAVPVLTAPADLATGQALSTTLSWEPVANAQSYRITFANNIDFTPAVFTTVVTTTSRVAFGLTNNTQYYWKVQAITGTVSSEWSPVRSFTTLLATPAVPTLVTPANLATDIEINPTLTWDAASNATSYQVQVSLDNTFITNVIDEVVTTTSKALTGLNNGIQYFWRVQAMNSAASSEWSATNSFTTVIGTTPLVAPTLATPLNDATGLIPAVTMTWNAVPTATMYFMQISTDNAFTSVVNEGIVLGLSHFQNLLAFNTPYFWRVKAVRGEENSAWSEVRTFTTMQALTAPVLVAPANNSTNMPYSFELSWNPVPNAVYYQLNISDNPGFYTYGTNTFETNYCMLSNLAPNVTSYWRIRAVRTLEGYGTERSAWSEVRSYTTAAPLGIPSLLSPNNEATNVSVNPTFNWSAVENAVSYSFQVSTTSDFTTTTVTDVVNTPTKSVIGLSQNTIYYWRVRSVSGELLGDWSSVYSFTTESPAPSIPMLISPENLATGVSVNRVFTWAVNENTTAHRFQLSLESTFTTNLVNEVVTTLTKAVSGLSNSTQYFWRVQAINGEFSSDWSEVFSFTTIAPTGGTINQNIPLVSGWNMISGYVTPQNTAVSAITSGISTQFKIMKNVAGQTYWPPFLTSLSAWNIRNAYYLNVNAPCTLTLTGTQIVPEQTPITLANTGWSWIPYYRTTAQAPATALSSISGHYTIVKSASGQTYWPPFMNSLTNLEPNKGYLIYITSAATLTYSANSAQNSGKVASAPVVDEPKVLVADYNNTGNSATLAIEIEGAKAGDEFGVYTKSGLLVGSAVYTGSATGVNIWGDNELTAQKDGAVEGDELEVKLLNVATNLKSNLTISKLTDVVTGENVHYMTYSDNGVFFANAKVSVASVENENSELSISPQPVKNEAVVSFTNQGNTSVNVELFDLTGVKVANYNFNTLTEGVNKLHIDASNLSAGMYNAIITSGANVQQVKMVKVD